MQGRRGFSWIELLVVIVVVLVLAVLLAHTLLHSIAPANEFSAISTVRSIQSAQLKYAQTYPALGFADNVAKLGPPPPGAQPNSNHANLLDPVTACASQPCARSGYLFGVDQTSGTPATNFRITAVPAGPRKNGRRRLSRPRYGSESRRAARGKTGHRG